MKILNIDTYGCAGINRGFLTAMEISSNIAMECGSQRRV